MSKAAHGQLRKWNENDDYDDDDEADKTNKFGKYNSKRCLELILSDGTNNLPIQM